MTSKFAGRAAPRLSKAEIRKRIAAYPRSVRWSNEDQIFIGRCRQLFGGGVHGKDKAKVAGELEVVIEEWVEIFYKDRLPLPPLRVS